MKRAATGEPSRPSSSWEQQVSKALKSSSYEEVIALKEQLEDFHNQAKQLIQQMDYNIEDLGLQYEGKDSIDCEYGKCENSFQPNGGYGDKCSVCNTSCCSKCAKGCDLCSLWICEDHMLECNDCPNNVKACSECMPTCDECSSPVCEDCMVECGYGGQMCCKGCQDARYDCC